MTLWDVLKSETNQVAYRVEEYRIRRMIEKGKLLPNDSIRPTGQSEWTRIADLPNNVWRDEMPDSATRKKLREENPTQAEPTPLKPPSRLLRPANPLSETVPVEMDQGRWPQLPSHGLSMEPSPDASSRDSARRSRVQPPPLRKAKPVEYDASSPIRSRKRHDEDLDLTAMADVTFLLIFFFMVTLAYAPQKSIETPPPSSQEQSAKQAPTMEDLRDDNVIVEVLADNSVLLNDRTVPPSELDELLRREINETGMNEVIIKAAGAAHHETVVRAYDAASEAGAQRIRLATVDSSESPGS
ncbi:biopolymer transporter ExbD [bacterium]|nr:biopolymer transporter ExbD [bacterium]